MIPTDRYCHSGPSNGDNSIILHNLFLVDKVLNAYYVKLLAPPTIIHPLYSKKNKNGTVH